jgi:2-methylcitrate dehydratase PrpD
MEYVAERWALEKCQKYGYFTKQTERFAKQYVYRALLEDVVFRMHPIEKIRQDILDWMGCTAKQVRRDSIKLGKIMLTKRVPRPEVLVFNEKDIVDAPAAYKALVSISVDYLTANK